MVIIDKGRNISFLHEKERAKREIISFLCKERQIKEGNDSSPSWEERIKETTLALSFMEKSVLRKGIMSFPRRGNLLEGYLTRL